MIRKDQPLAQSRLLTVYVTAQMGHIILSGDFDWHSGAAERQFARPLHIRTAREWEK